MKRSLRNLCAASCLSSTLLAALTLPLHAQALGAKWQRNDRAAEQALLAGNPEAALRTLARVLHEMMERMGPGKGGKLAMGIVLMHRALAEADLGQKEAALWDWDVALNFNPALAREDLMPFGEAGRLLHDHPLRSASAETQGKADAQEPLYPELGVVEPPKVRKAPRPVFPVGARDWGLQGAITVQVILTKDGRVTQPLVLADLDAATITFSALEALRQWTFRPAHLEGRPVSVFYNLTVNYRLRP